MDTNELYQTEMASQHSYTKGEKGGGMNWEIRTGMNIHTAMYKMHN